MSDLNDWVFTLEDGKETTASQIDPPDAHIPDELNHYLPLGGLKVATKIENDSLMFDLPPGEGWDEVARALLNRLEYREVGNTGILVARPKLGCGAPDELPSGDIVLHHARIIKSGNTLNSIFHWYFKKPVAADYVYTCWTW